MTIQFLKNPDLPHWGFEGHALAEDEHGLWVALPTGSRRWRGEEVRSPTATPAVLCFPHRGWWALHYTGLHTRYSHFVDITTQPTWGNGRVEMIDLDLDVVRHRDGAIEVEDEDEFATHQVVYSYTTQMIERARQETDRVVEMLEQGREPFYDVAEEWLRQALG